MALISTLLGDIEDSDLIIEEERENAACGMAVTRRYFWRDELVRQDCTIEIEKGIILGGKGGF